MEHRSSGKLIRTMAAVVTGGIAFTGFAGSVGLIGGGLSFGPAISARLPLGSLVLAGLALLVFVAVPMTIAALAAARDNRFSGDAILGSGLLLVFWIAVQLAFIKTYSWFHPTYLAAAMVVLGLGWLMVRRRSRPTEASGSRHPSVTSLPGRATAG
jgi:hypothetical protein